MPDDPAVKKSEHTPIVSALLGLPGVTQIGRATGLIGAAPSSEPAAEKASKVVTVARVHKYQGRAAQVRGEKAFVAQTTASRKAYDGLGSGRENSPGAMAPASKASISVIAIGETVGATYTDFILTSLNEQEAEKIEIVETFGAFHLFASGRFARKYQFMGSVRAHPTNHASPGAASVPAVVKMRNLYEQHLRATVQAARQTFTRVTVDRDSYDGWLTSFTLARDASSEFLAQFSFTMVAYRRTHEKDAAALQLLQDFDAITGKQRKPIPRLVAEVAAAIGACEPAWYVGDVKTTKASTVVAISDDDTGLAGLSRLRVLLKSESGQNTAVGGVCKITAKLAGKDIELSSLGIATDIFNLTSPQDVFTGNVTFRAIVDAAGADTATLEITATGSSSSGQPAYSTLVIPLRVAGKPNTRIAGYNIYGGAAGAALIGTMMFPEAPGSTPPYKPALLDTIAIPVARMSAAGAPTVFKLSAEPICVDSKTGATVAIPAGLQLTLSLYTGATNKLAAASGPVTNSKVTLDYTYATDLEAAGGADAFQKFGATAVSLTVAASAQDGIDATPIGTCEFKLTNVRAPFTCVSPLVGVTGNGYRGSASESNSGIINVMFLLSPGFSPAAALALVTQLTITGTAPYTNVHVNTGPGGGLYVPPSGGQPLPPVTVKVVTTGATATSPEKTWLVCSTVPSGGGVESAFVAGGAAAGSGAVIGGPPGLPLPVPASLATFQPVIAAALPWLIHGSEAFL